MTTTTLPQRRLPNPSRTIAVVMCLVTAAACGLALAMTGSLLPLILLVGAGLGVGLLARPEVGTLTFLALMWVNAPGVAARYHGFPDVLVNTVVLLLFVPVAGYLLSRRSLVVTPALFAILFFLVGNLVSAAMSQDPAAGWGRILSFLSEGLLVYLLVTNAIRTPATMRAATLVLVLAAVFMAGLSVHQELTGAYRDPYLGFSQTTRQEDAAYLQPDADSRPRMMGPVGEQNRYAQILLVVLPLALFGLNLRGKRWRRIAAIGAGVMIVAGVLLTFSRGAAVALALLLVAMVIWKHLRLKHLLAVACAFLVTMLLIAPEFVTRLDTIRTASSLVTGESDDESPDNAILGRTTSNLAALLVFVDHPIFGVGPNLYAARYSQDYGNELGLRHLGTSRRAHNMYLEWAAELGIVGLAAGVGALVVTIVQLRALRRYWRWRQPAYSNMAGAYALALVAYMGTAVFLHLSYERYFFTLLAIANAVIWILSRERAILESHVGGASTNKNAPTAKPSRWLHQSPSDRARTIIG